MNSLDSSGSRFSDKQVAQILRRAAELQSSSGSPQSPAAGSSASEILQIGGEIGIDPRCIQQAIDELASGDGPKRTSWLGGPVAMDTERTCPGMVDDEAWQNIVSESRTTFSRIGSTSSFGAVREWSGGEKDLDSIHLSAHSKDGSTRFRARSDLSGSLFLSSWIAFIIALMSTTAVLQVKQLGWEVRIALAIAIVGILGLALRGFVGVMAKRRQKAITRLFSKLGPMVSHQEPQELSQSHEEPLHLRQNT